MTSKEFLDHLYYHKLPQVYRDADISLVDQPLKRYLSALVDGGYAESLEDMNKVLELIDPEKCPKEILPIFCESFGLPYFEDISDMYQRRFLANIGEIIKRRGTYSCVKFLVRALTGLDVEMSYLRGEHDGKQGRHLIITLLANNMEALLNMDTNRIVVERYIQTQIPYYIHPQVNSKIAIQKVENKLYRGNTITMQTSYNLIPLEKRRMLSYNDYMGCLVQSELVYNLTGGN